MTVASILRAKGSSVYSIEPTRTLKEAAAAMAERNVGSLMVIDRTSRLVGIVSERDMVRVIARGGSTDMLVSSPMSTEVFTCTTADKIEDLMRTMTERRIRHLPVMDDNSVVGMVSIGDVVKSRMADVEEEATLLRAYISL